MYPPSLLVERGRVPFSLKLPPHFQVGDTWESIRGLRSVWHRHAMIEYQMRYKHGDAEREFVMGEFNSEKDALDWWKLMTSDGKHKPRDWVLERRDGAGWVVVATHDARVVE